MEKKEMTAGQTAQALADRLNESELEIQNAEIENDEWVSCEIYDNYGGVYKANINYFDYGWQLVELDLTGEELTYLGYDVIENLYLNMKEIKEFLDDFNNENNE